MTDRLTGWNRMLKPADLVLALLVVAGGIAFPFMNAPAKTAEDRAVVVVAVDRKPWYTGPLQKDTVLSVRGAAGTSVVVIRDGRVSFAESVCRDKLCVRSGPIDHAGQWLLCLPNRVLVQIRARMPEGGPDGVSR